MEKTVLDVQDVMKAMGCKESKAYRIIRELNKERKKRGYITFNGQVSKRYFEDRLGVKVTE